MSDGPSFFEELKRRKVARVALVYLAVSWAVVQVADVFVPALGLPETILSAVAVIAILGFPVAVGLAWAFDVGSSGVTRTGKAIGSDASQGWVSARTVAVAVVLLAVGWLAGRAGRETSPEPPADGRATRVAVLPFRDLGAVDDATNFAAGMHDDILTQLSRIDALRVTSRTSVERYAGTDKSIPTIATELGVGAVLEGGIQRTPARVRINMQLIDGRTDEHLWAETYDRELTAENVFAIQSEIAHAVASALEAALTPEDENELAEVPTTDLGALELYHRGRYELDRNVDSGDTNVAISLLERAVELDPGFRRAWAELARARSWAIRVGEQRDTVAAWAAVQRVQALAPGSVDAVLAAGVYRYYARGDLLGALELFTTAQALRPGDTDVRFARANIQRRVGRWEEAAALYAEVAAAEPGNPRGWMDRGWTLRWLRRFDEAARAYRTAQALDTTYGGPLRREADAALWGSGDTAVARALLRSDVRDGDDPAFADAMRRTLWYLQRDPRSYRTPPAPGLRDEAVFDAYELVLSGGISLARARMAWVLGDEAGARALLPDIRASFASGNPAFLGVGPPVPEDRDFFSVRGSALMVDAWEAVWSGRPREALDLADRAVRITSNGEDAISAAVIQRQRALVRVTAGDLDGAMADLTELIARPGFTTAQELRLDPIYDPLKERADFQALVGG